MSLRHRIWHGSHPRVAFVMLSLALAGCRGSPQEEAFVPETPAEFVPELSRIETPIQIPVEELRRLVDDRLSGQIYSETRTLARGVALNIVVNRRDAPVQMAMQTDTLTTAVPVNVNGQVSVGVGPFSVGRAEGFDADLDVHVNSVVRLQSDWSVQADSTVEVDVSRAAIAIPGLNVDASTILEELFARNSERIAAPLDNFLEELNLLDQVEPIWEGFRSPLQVTADPPVWLQVRPEAFSLSPPAASAENLRFDIGMEAYMESFVGNRPEPLPLGEIPPLDELDQDSRAFHVVLPITLELEAATEALSRRILEREDTIGSRAKVRWLGVQLSGTGNRLQADVQFEAETGLWIVNELSGRMRVQGRPSYDRDSQTLRVGEMDYELESDSRLAGIADWLLHDRLRDRIQEELVFPLADAIALLRQRLQSELGNVSLGPYGAMETEIASLSPESLRVNDQTIELLVRADGSMSMDLTLPVN